MDEHTKGEELGLATEGSMLTEKEIKELGKEPEIDFPMPGEIADLEEEKEHLHEMPEPDRFKVIGEDGKEL
jgi:hypothetical protein